jgi:anti-sigma B factor antagonist
MPTRAFTATSRPEDGSVWVVRVSGELDLETVPRFQATLDEVLASRPATVLLGLEDVDFLDSTGLRVIVTTRKELEARGASLLIDGLSGAVQQVLDVAGLLTDLTSGPATVAPGPARARRDAGQR